MQGCSRAHMRVQVRGLAGCKGGGAHALPCLLPYRAGQVFTTLAIVAVVAYAVLYLMRGQLPPNSPPPGMRPCLPRPSLLAQQQCATIQRLRPLGIAARL